MEMCAQGKASLKMICKYYFQFATCTVITSPSGRL